MILLSKSYISLNTYEVIEAHLLNICFDLKRTLSQCAAVFIINKEQDQAQEEKRLEGLSEGRMKIILKREKLEDKSLEELLTIAKLYGAPDQELLEMIEQINYAQDYEVPYIRETLLNYLLSTGPSGDGGGGLQPNILRQRLLDAYDHRNLVLEEYARERARLRLSGLSAIAVRYHESEKIDGRRLYLKSVEHCRPYIQEVLMVENLSRKDAVSVKVSMQPFLHKKALEKLSETKKIPLSKLKEELEKASGTDPLRTEIYKKMYCANGEYKLPTTETERILSFKPTDISQTIAYKRTKEDIKLDDILEGDIEFSSSSSNKQDDIYYGYPEDLDKKLDIGTIKKMIYEVIEFINDPLNPK